MHFFSQASDSLEKEVHPYEVYFIYGIGIGDLPVRNRGFCDGFHGMPLALLAVGGSGHDEELTRRGLIGRFLLVRYHVN